MCNFPAARLLAVRREISEAKGLEIIEVVGIINAIDEARWNHEEKTNCQCWYEALAAARQETGEVAA